jgi:hypothetical protein
MVLLEKDDDNGNANYALTVDNNNACTGLSWNVFFQTSGGADYNDCYAATINTGSWYFITGSWDGSDLRLYVNGSLVQTTNHSSKVPTTGSGSVMLGNEAGNSFYFNGVLDDARVYNRKLSDAEVTTLYNGGSGCSD